MPPNHNEEHGHGASWNNQVMGNILEWSSFLFNFCFLEITNSSLNVVFPPGHDTKNKNCLFSKAGSFTSIFHQLITSQSFDYHRLICRRALLSLVFLLLLFTHLFHELHLMESNTAIKPVIYADWVNNSMNSPLLWVNQCHQYIGFATFVFVVIGIYFVFF